MLAGKYHVKASRQYFSDNRQLFTKLKDMYILRSHTPELRNFQENKLLDYEAVHALSGLDIYELRVNATIGGFDNLRVIFMPEKNKSNKYGMPYIWALYVFQKKTNHLTKAQLATMKARRKLVLEREI